MILSDILNVIYRIENNNIDVYKNKYILKSKQLYFKTKEKTKEKKEGKKQKRKAKQENCYTLDISAQ